MRDFRNRSKEKLTNEVSQVLKDLMVSCLDRAEKILKPDKESSWWKQFRFDVLNLGNDKIRLMQSKIGDYLIEYRPAIFSVEYNTNVPISNIVTFDFIAETDRVEFSLVTTTKNIALSLQKMLGCGETGQNQHGAWVFVVKDIFSILHRLIPFFDSSSAFKGPTLGRYLEWKEKVYSLEKESD